jgi:murein L,D-transpeptidase YafK
MHRRPVLLLFATALAGCASVPPPPRVAEQPPGLPLPPFPERPAAPRAAAPQVDFVLVDKSDRTLTLYADGRPVKTYTGIQLGGAPVGAKRFEGDRRTPEGRYAIDYRNPQSAYHLSLHISYPNANQIADARSRGRSPGGAIFIHGQPNWMASGRAPGDWTDGCIALSDAEIEELWSAVPDGTPIEIEP